MKPCYNNPNLKQEVKERSRNKISSPRCTLYSQTVPKDNLITDMHIHTTYSDGSLKPAEIVSLAAKLDIQKIAVTDHDTMAGCSEAIEAGRKAGINVISGVEISAYDFQKGRKVHILGYDIKDVKALEAACRPFLESRHQARLKALQRIIEAGYPVTEAEVLGYIRPGGTLYRQHIMNALLDRGYAVTIYGELYRKLFARTGIAFIQSKYMDVFDALKLVLDTGGTAVLAHPYLYDSEDLLPELVESGLSGIEVWSSKHTAQQTADLKRLAKRYGLEQYEGSDFHGFYSERVNPLGSTMQGGA